MPPAMDWLLPASQTFQMQLVACFAIKCTEDLQTLSICLGGLLGAETTKQKYSHRCDKKKIWQFLIFFSLLPLESCVFSFPSLARNFGAGGVEQGRARPYEENPPRKTVSDPPSPLHVPPPPGQFSCQFPWRFPEICSVDPLGNHFRGAPKNGLQGAILATYCSLVCLAPPPPPSAAQLQLQNWAFF